MLLLALDTATHQATVAVSDGEKPLAQRQCQVTTHSEKLLELIHQALEEVGCVVADLDAVVCGRGPGSFTGLRIGLATAKGLCFAAEKPLVCMSSLVPLALAVEDALCTGAALATGDLASWRGSAQEGAGSVPPEASSSTERRPVVAALLDARRQEVFCGLFQKGQPLQEESLHSPEALVAHLNQVPRPLILAGNGAQLYQDILLGQVTGPVWMAPAPCHTIAARYLAQAAASRVTAGDYDDLEQAIPLYIRASDARLPQRPFLGTPTAKGSANR